MPIVAPEDAAAELLKRRAARKELRHYVEYLTGMAPARHMTFFSKKIDLAAEGAKKRLALFLPPGSGKSIYASHHFPAQYISRFPNRRIIHVTHTTDFAEDFGRKVRNTIESDEHQTLFPNVQISSDSRAAGRWGTTNGGEYYATGVGGTVTGKRAHMIIIDDPLRGYNDAESLVVRDNLWNFYGSDLMTRLLPGGVIILIQTRWHLDDLAGRLLAAQSSKGADQWEVVSLPAIAREKDPLGRKEGEALWPEWQSLEALENIRSQPSMTGRQFAALYQQNPVEESGNLIKRDWFKPWRFADPPVLLYTLQSWDTAVSAKDTAAYSACTTWGIFEEPETKLPAMILLSAFRGRLLYPDLRKMAQRLAFNYTDDNLRVPQLAPAKRQPSQILVEDRSSGSSLIADLMRAGISVIKVNPSRHGSKDARLMLATDLLENGRVFVPYMSPQFTMPRRWADDFVTELASFPAASSRDFADSFSQAVDRVKVLGIVRNSDDPYEESIPRDRGIQKEAFY